MNKKQLLKHFWKKKANRCNVIYRAKQKLWTRNGYNKVKEEMFEHYGRVCANPQCWAKDHTSDPSYLSILSFDHINDDGAKHRRHIFETRTKSFLRPTVRYSNPGINGLYRYCKENGWPKILQCLCMNCQFLKRAGHLTQNMIDRIVPVRLSKRRITPTEEEQ